MRPHHRVATTIVVATMIALGSARASAACQPWVAKLVSAQGTVETRSVSDGSWRAVKLDDTFCPGDTLRTGAHSRAAVLLHNETIVRLDQQSALTLSGIEAREAGFLDLLSGIAHFLSRVPRALTIKTPYVNAAVEGTEFVVAIELDAASVTVIEGRVRAENPQGQVVLTAGQAATARKGEAPVLKVTVKPRDAVEWAIHYPAIADYRVVDFEQVTEPWRAVVSTSIEAYRAGDVSGALAAVRDTPSKVRDSRFFTYRAGLLLSVGRLDEARDDLAHATAVAPNDAETLALNAIVAVVQDDKAAALDLAGRAVAAAPGSASVYLARSYARQAKFDIDGALFDAQAAVAKSPDSALAWARLAELQLSVGDHKRALEAAGEAVSRDPNSGRAQTVLGFVRLSRIEVTQAKESFEKAIVLDQADPLPRLGLGLARIRKGAVEEGRREIEIAASLDPTNSSVRSYLGKAYYEEKRNQRAADQFELAKQYDPNDPTPYLYEAIRKQTENQPIGALQDLQKSIELNDNRAVYRSRLLLDQDLASRSASLARIYSDIGFGQRALLEGWKSINTDPSDYSGHRFLADTYSSLPRHEIARVSELLQAQLLQPINMNSLQPQQAESNLAILEGAGTLRNGLNEYSPLFVSNRTSLQVNGLFGNHSTLGDDLILSGIQDRVSYSIGQFHYETDGFRPNNDLRHNIYGAFFQTFLSPAVSMQFEYRYQDSESGDLLLQGDPATYAPAERRDILRRTTRVGFDYKPTVHSDIIASVIYRDFREGFSDQSIFSDPDFVVQSDLTDVVDGHAYIAELQYLHRAQNYSLVSGAGSLRGTAKNDFTLQDTQIEPPPPEVLFVDTTSVTTKTRHDNAYAYLNLRTAYRASWTLGLAYDTLDNDVVDEDRSSPKLGVIWQLASATTLRAAWFRSLKRPVVGNQTVEPTQVAGFNQFFDDPNGSRTERYGVAIEQSFSPVVYVGAEATWRDINIPTLVQPANVTTYEDVDERAHRAYLYWAPTTNATLSAEYFLERFQRARGQPSDVETHRLPLGATYHLVSGFMGQLRASRVHQDVTSGGATEQDRFWTIDASFGYRLPRRRGIVSIGVQNLLDEQFNYYDVDLSGQPRVPLLQPSRSVFSRFTLSF